MSHYSGRHRPAQSAPAMQQAMTRPLVPLIAVTATSGLLAWGGHALAGNGGTQDDSTTTTASAVPATASARIEGEGSSQASRASRGHARSTSLAGVKAAAVAEAKSIATAKPSSTEDSSEPGENLPDAPANGGDARAIARSMVAARGWSEGQFKCLNSLWNRESGWNHRAKNPSSGAYGIPQSLPGSKMASAGSDWRTNPATQIKWGLGYIAERYGTPCGAWAHSERVGWY